MIDIQVQINDFDIGVEQKFARGIGFDIGALVLFVGLVRDFQDERKLIELELEHYPGMTEKALLTICESAKSRWDLKFVKVIHRYGKLSLGDQIVMVMVASKHRKAAFDSANFIMDFLKSRAPFWKKEATLESQKWVDADELDEVRLSEWVIKKKKESN